MIEKTKSKPRFKFRKKPVVRRSYLEQVFPISNSKDGFIINLAGMKKHSPIVGLGYAPFQKIYKTQEEAETVRKQLGKTIKMWVDNYM